MYVILVYDISEQKVGRALKICREYLNRIQNSVFEGEITDSNFLQLSNRLKELIDPETDSVIIFKLWDKTFKREVIGIEKNKLDNII